MHFAWCGEAYVRCNFSQSVCPIVFGCSFFTSVFSGGICALASADWMRLKTENSTGLFSWKNGVNFRIGRYFELQK